MLSPELVVRIVRIMVFGIFSISVCQTSKLLVSLSVTESFLLALFVIFQVPILRTSWDLHCNMLALTTLLFSFAYGLNNKNMSNRTFVSVTTLCIISVRSDRMIGALLTTSLVIYCIVWKNRKCTIPTTVSSIIFLIAFFQGSNEIMHDLHISTGLNPINSTYNPISLLVLFIVTNLLLIPTGIIGFCLRRRRRQQQGKVPSKESRWLSESRLHQLKNTTNNLSYLFIFMGLNSIWVGYFTR